MKKRLALLTAIVAAPLLGMTPQEELDDPQEVLAIFAHPDDELFVAPALARAAREGHKVTLVLATSGDQGPGVSDLEPGEELAAARRGEARCSAGALGLAGAVFLEHGDGTLTAKPRDARSPARRLTADIAAIIADEQPDIVVTFGPDGGYGHGDHRMVSALVTQVVQAMDTNRPALLYPGIRKGTLPPIAQMRDWAETAPELLTVAYRYGDEDLAAARAAAQCHATQFDAATRAQVADLFHATIWGGAVHFRPALPGG